MKKIFVTGGAGFVGSHCVISLVENGYVPIILDNFSNSKKNIIKKLEIITNKKIIFYKIDIRDKKKLRSIFKKHSCYAVIHCAGSKAVGESTEKPILYFENNVGSTLSLLECMRERKIFKIIFSSSASVYNLDKKSPLKETSELGNIKNPYGTSKYIIEKILADLSNFDNKWSVRIARYFNPIGNHYSGLLREDPNGKPNNLVPYITRVIEKKLPILNIYGRNYNTKDGTGIRDYIHVMDLAEAHIEMINNNRLKKGLKIYNFGTGKGLSVLDVIQKFETQLGISIPYKFAKRRKGDTAISICNPKKALKDLNWRAKFNFEQAVMDITKRIK